MFTSKSKGQSGFTLIELLIVIAIIAILAAVVFVALDPLSRFQDSRDSQRWSDVSAVVSAIKTDQVDNGGDYLTEIEDLDANAAYVIGGCDSGATCSSAPTTTQDDCVDLGGLVDEGYLGSVPVDPSDGTAEETGYYIIRRDTGLVEVGACSPEGTGEIKVSN